MSLQWTLIAGFLYLEIAVVLLLVLPIASARRWNSFFKSKFLQVLQRQAGFYFLILLAILVLFLLDAIREMRKYSNLAEADEHGHAHLDREMQGSMRLFRAQRNFYISGFALFLSLVIRRLVILISNQATLEAQSEASMRQAQSATTAAKSLLAQRGEVAQNDSNEAHDKEVIELKAKLVKVQDELKLEKKDKNALKEQADNLAKEYDRLAEEHSKLQKKLTVGYGDKKDE
ncbi:B-cell receptor-associated protein 29 isoform X1 [Leptinotarsa decemlineata]|uniref:B-cell receptor-associated protein 29 isoform X1 n=1 Tax=Leptinotarsa decemlineata TaxID=7539 RepID=UPI003D309051